MADREGRRGSILVVDDSQANVDLLQRVLEREGYAEVTTTTDPNEVVSLYLQLSPDLLVLDLHMPSLDGFGVMQELRQHVPEDAYFPILVISGDENRDARHRALAGGAKDFINKPFDRGEVVLRVRNLLEARFLHQELEIQNLMLESKVQARTETLVGALRDVERSRDELLLAQRETVQRLATAAELRDDDTGQHIQRMSRYCALLAERIGMPAERVELLGAASQMHDLGKIGVPDAILQKPGPLDDAERAIIQTHSQIGHDILRDSTSELLGLGALVALTHHERFDGGGYPRGLQGHRIPIEGRLAAIADVFDALTSDRVYRKAFSIPQALEMMAAERGAAFDPDLLDEFLRSAEDIIALVRGNDAPVGVSS